MKTVKPIQRLSLGRPGFLGQLYNQVSDQILPSMAFKDGFGQGEIMSQDCGNNDFKYELSQRLEDKFHLLNVQAELQLSLLGGMINVEGSGKFLDQQKSEFKGVQCSVMLQITTQQELINCSDPKIRAKVALETLNFESASHFISGITWGAKVAAQLVVEDQEGLSQTEVEGALKAVCRQLAFSIQGSAKVEFNEAEKKIAQNMRISIFSDVVPETGILVTSFESFMYFVKQIQSAIQLKNNGKGVPISFHLIPLHEVDDPLQRRCITMINELNMQSLQCCQSIIANIQDVQSEIGSIETQAYRYREMHQQEINQLVKIKAQFQSASLQFQQKLKYNLIQFRQSDLSSSAGLIDDHLVQFSQSAFHPEKIRSQIKPVKIKIELKNQSFDSFQKSGVEILSPTQSIQAAFLERQKHLYILQTHFIKFFQENSELSTQVHTFFMSLVTKEQTESSQFYLLDYETSSQKHDNATYPRIYCYRQSSLVTTDYFFQQQKISSILKTINYISVLPDKILLSPDEFKDLLKQDSDIMVLLVASNTQDIGDDMKIRNNYLTKQQEKSLDVFCGHIKDNAVRGMTKDYHYAILEADLFKNSIEFKNTAATQIFYFIGQSVITDNYLQDQLYINQIVLLIQTKACQFINGSNYLDVYKNIQKSIILAYDSKQVQNDFSQFTDQCQKFGSLQCQEDFYFYLLNVNKCQQHDIFLNYYKIELKSATILGEIETVNSKPLAINEKQGNVWYK